jgi:hypothetical protein
MRTTPEGIQVIPYEYREVVALLDLDELRAIEAQIAAAHQLPVLRDRSPVLINLTQAELSVCGMTANEIQQYLRDNCDSIVRLALKMKEDIADTDEEEYPEGEEQDPSGESTVLGMANGFGLSHAIYHHFLAHRSGKELRAFLKNRRVPFHTKFAKQLEGVFASLTPDGTG